jgi:GNAT superfamily N-acetyltransferase
MKPGYRVTTEVDEIDHRAVWEWIHDEAYWAQGRPWELHQIAVAESLCFGIVADDGSTAGFCRVVTDRVSFAWLADVVVLPEHRGQGLGKVLVAAVVAHPDLAGIKRILLGTADAHGLYAQYGFAPLRDPTRFMERRA